MFRIAHVSDPHFQSLREPAARLLRKRLLGGVNLLLRRRRKHRMPLLEAMAEDLRQKSSTTWPHRDLCNIALASEWARALG